MVSRPTVIKRDVDTLPYRYLILSNKPLGEVYKANDSFVETIHVLPVCPCGVCGRDKEVAVEIDKAKLKYFNLSVAKVAKRIKAENVLNPAGSLVSGQTRDQRAF